MKPTNHLLAARVKDLRTKRGFSQDELATRAGITARTIQRIERGAVNPFNHTLKRVARALEVDFEELASTHGQEGPVRKRLVLFHLSPLMGFVVPFAQLLAPLSMWLVYRREERELNCQIREILLFHALSTVLLISGFVMIWRSLVIGYFLVGGIILGCTATTMWNAYRVSENLPHRYFPRVIRVRKAGNA